MTQRSPTTSKAGFADLRQQIAALVCDTQVPPDQLGKLPESQLHSVRRNTLHLNPVAKKTGLKPSGE